MAIDPPYRLDPFRNIVNIHWEKTDGPCGDTLYLFNPDEANHNAFWLVIVAQWGGEAPNILHVNWYGYGYEVHKTLTNSEGGMNVWIYHKIPNVDRTMSPIPGDYENEIEADKAVIDQEWNGFVTGHDINPTFTDAVKDQIDTAIEDILQETSQGNFGTENEGLNYSYDSQCPTIPTYQYVRVSVSASLIFGWWSLGPIYIPDGEPDLNYNNTVEHGSGLSNALYWGFPSGSETWQAQVPPVSWSGSFDGTSITLTISDGTGSHTRVSDYSGATLTANYGSRTRTWVATGMDHQSGPDVSENAVGMSAHIIFTLQE